MPGANCAIFGCSTSRKTKGLAIFRVPTGDDEYSKTWRERIVNIITKDRVIDKGLKNQIDKRTLFTCELHYPEEDLIRNESRTTRIPGVVPTLNLPVKTCASKSFPERSTSSISKREEAIPSTSSTSCRMTSCYNSFLEFKCRINKLKLPDGWVIKSSDPVQIFFYDNEYITPKFEIYINEDLSYNIRIFNWLLSQEHDLISKYGGSMNNITLSNLISSISSYSICEGVTYKSNI